MRGLHDDRHRDPVYLCHEACHANHEIAGRALSPLRIRLCQRSQDLKVRLPVLIVVHELQYAAVD